MKKIILLAVLILPVIISGCVQNGNGDIVACPEDARICPDGSSVVRVPPECDFAPCPEPEEPEVSELPENTIVIDDYQFTPRNVTIRKGDTITWLNNDTRTHAIGSAKLGTSGTMHTGDSWNYTFNEIGVFKYTCTFHFQKGWITVEE